MKKTDLFKLTFVCAIYLLGSMWNSTYAQEKKTGTTPSNTKVGAAGTVAPGAVETTKVKNSDNNGMLTEAEMQAERSNPNSKVSRAVVKAKENDAARKEKLAQQQLLQNQKKSESPIKGSAQMVANQPAQQTVADQPKNTGAAKTTAPGMDKLTADFKTQVSKIVAGATSYDAAKKQIFQVYDKTVESVDAQNNRPFNGDTQFSEEKVESFKAGLMSNIESALQNLQVKLANSKN